jgi:hypothetical protein
MSNHKWKYRVALEKLFINKHLRNKTQQDATQRNTHMTTIIEDSDSEEGEEDDDDISSEEVDTGEEESDEESVRAPLVMPDFVGLARDIQNRNNSAAISAATQARQFKEFFGTSLFVIEILWEMLYERDLLPDNGEPRHLLWTLFFMKTYPKQGHGCSVVGASSGAVDPKTMKKWVWEYIDSIGELVDEVVRIFIHLLFFCCHLTLTSPS